MAGELMTDKDRTSRNASRSRNTEPDSGDTTPPHGDELIRERSFGRTDRYANLDDAEPEDPVLQPKSLITDPDEFSADEQRRLMEQIDDAAASDARMATRKRERRHE
jgi:hypothetical protein